jgi:hypothetical protein
MLALCNAEGRGDGWLRQDVPTPEDTATETWEDVSSMVDGMRVCISSRFRVRVTVGEFLGRVASRDQYRVRGKRVGTNWF